MNCFAVKLKMIYFTFEYKNFKKVSTVTNLVFIFFFAVKSIRR